VRTDTTVDVVLRYLRLRGELPDHTDHLYVVSRRHQYLGRIALQSLLTSEPSTPVNRLIDDEQPAIDVHESEADVARRFSDHDWISAPVVDDSNILLGRITIDDVVDIIREQAEHQALGAAGLGEDEDLFSPVPRATRRRLLWLGINLGTAFLAASVVGLFTGTIDAFPILAVFMPIVAGMGGNAATQTLTVIVRGIALGELTWGNSRKALLKEAMVGIGNGVALGLVAALVAWATRGDPVLGVVLGTAMVINMFVAATAGVLIPLGLRAANVDPALASSVFITTMTDVFGFLSFLGLATIFARYLTRAG
jgi:magnesium transporter